MVVRMYSGRLMMRTEDEAQRVVVAGVMRTKRANDLSLLPWSYYVRWLASASKQIFIYLLYLGCCVSFHSPGGQLVVWH